MYSNGNLSIYSFFQEKHTQPEKIAFIKEHYGIGGCSHALFGASGSWMEYDGKGMRFRKEGCADVSLSWAQVAKRIDDLIAGNRYLSEEAVAKLNQESEQDTIAVDAPRQPETQADGGDMSEFFSIDTEKVRQGLAERGIVNGKLVDSEKLAQDPFAQQVEADVEQIAAENEVQFHERFSVIETENGYAIWDDMDDDYYVDDEGVSEEFTSEWQAESYLQEVRKAYQEKKTGEPQPVASSVTDAPALPYSVGDTLYLENGKPFIIEEIGLFNVRLRDPSLAYPIARAESKESLARLLERYLQSAQPAQETLESVEHQAVSETVAVYPAEQNHLPYDVVVERLHFPDPEHIPVPEITPTAENFRITDDHLGEGGAKTKYIWNVEAIRTLQAIEAERRQATPDEQEILSRYVGWGGIPQAFDESNAAWSKEYAELKELLPEAEYASARASTLNAHYTSPTVIRAIYDAIERMGFRTGNVLEPACGVGNFFGLLPESMTGSNLYATELDSITGRIAGQLYPQANIAVQGFEKTDRRDFYDLAVGNVPFGNYKVPDRAYDKLGFNIHDYFFVKASDQVRPGGVIAFITSKGTMDTLLGRENSRDKLTEKREKSRER